MINSTKNLPSDDTNDNNNNLDTNYDIIGIRQSYHNTSHARCHASLSIHEQLDLKALKEITT